MKALAMQPPDARDVGDLVKTLAAAAGMLGGLWAVCARVWKRRQERRRVRDLEAKAIRYLLDAQRHTLHVLAPGPDRFLELGEIERQKALIDQVRDEVWVADGHGGEREAQRRAEEIARVLTRTQAIRAKQDAQAEAAAHGTVPMFKEHQQ